MRSDAIWHSDSCRARRRRGQGSNGAQRHDSTAQGVQVGTRQPTRYEVFHRDEGGVLHPLGWTAANKPEQAKRELGGDVAVPVRSLN